MSFDPKEEWHKAPSFLRLLKRRISNLVYRRLIADAKRGIQ